MTGSDSNFSFATTPYQPNNQYVKPRRGSSDSKNKKLFRIYKKKLG